MFSPLSLSVTMPSSIAVSVEPANCVISDQQFNIACQALISVLAGVCLCWS